jgi:hypothetical protein
MYFDIVGDAGVKVALITATYTPNDDTHTVWTDVTNELTATGYTTGGSALAGKGITVDTVNNRSEFDATDLTWDPIGNGTNGTFTQIVVWDDTPTNDPIIAHIDTAGTLTNGGAITLEWDAEGILQIG